MTEAEERDAFYQAILDDWDDDTPRLVYADWLDERDDKASHVRAEFIRVQCEIAKRERAGLKPAPLYKREAELLSKIQSHLQERGLGITNGFGDFLKFERGFGADWWNMSPEYYSQGSPDVWSDLGPIDVPGIHFKRSSTRSRPSPEYRKLAMAPGLRYWRRVPTTSGLGDSLIGEANFVTLFSSRKLVSLRSIEITDQTRRPEYERVAGIGERGLKALIRNSALRRLSSLTLWWSGVDDAGLHILAGAKHLTNLRHLSLADHFTDKGVLSLLSTELLAKVESLHLNGRLTATSLKLLAESPRLKRLHTLDLNGYRSGAHELDSLHYGNLSRILEGGLRMLLDSPLLGQLKVLKLCPDVGLEELINAAPRMTALQQLDLADHCYGEELHRLREAFPGKLLFWGQPDNGE